MAVQVRIQNFQSIKDQTLEIEGLTVIAGQNNAGKTAVIRALTGVFANTPGHYYVRNGEDFCSVELTFEDGNTVLWEKGPKIRPRYRINGGPYLHPGKEVPQQVLDLGVLPITAANQTLWPQIAQQFTGQVFLLDQPGSVVAETVADVERVGKLSKALKLAQSDRRSISSDLKVRRKDLQDLQNELDGYAGIDAVSDELDSIEGSWKQVRETGSSILATRKLRDGLRSAQAQIAALEGIDKVGLPGPQAAQDASETKSRIHTLRGIGTRYKAAQAACASLEGVESLDIPVVGDTAKVVESIRSLSRLRGRLETAQETLQRMQEVAGVEQYGSGYLEEDAVGCIKVKGAVLNLKQIAERHTAALLEQKKLERSQQEARAELDTAESQVKTLLGDRGECPVCGTVVQS